VRSTRSAGLDPASPAAELGSAAGMDVGLST
jgi:hypothetical protein